MFAAICSIDEDASSPDDGLLAGSLRKLLGAGRHLLAAGWTHLSAADEASDTT